MKSMEQSSEATCDICYGTLLDKAILNCSHELCIKCLLKITNDKRFQCHMCRRKHNWNGQAAMQSLKHSSEQNGIASREVDLSLEEEESPLRPLFIEKFPNEICSFYKARLRGILNHDELHYVFLCIHNLETHVIRDTIQEHVNQHSHGNLKQGNVKLQMYHVSLETENVDCYIQDYYDVIIKRIIL